MSDQKTDAAQYYTRIIDHALAGIAARSKPDHTYTVSAAIDSEIYAWFRRRWPVIGVSDNADEHYLVDPDWWHMFVQHFKAHVPDIEEPCMLQLSVAKPLNMDNFRFVVKGVWLAVEVCRSREAVR